MFDQQELRTNAPLRYKWLSDWNPDSRLCAIDMQFWTGSESFVESHVQRAYSEQEIRDCMETAGFSRVQLFDAYSLEPSHSRSDRIHVLGIGT
jgi:hypothetical protein